MFMRWMTLFSNLTFLFHVSIKFCMLMSITIVFTIHYSNGWFFILQCVKPDGGRPCKLET